MRILVAGLITSAVLAVTTPAQSRPIPVEDAIEAIRFFRGLALDTVKDTALLNFCQIKEAFDADGNLRRNRGRDPVPFSTRSECTRAATADVPPANGVYFESVRRSGGKLVFRASRLYGQAISKQEYVVSRIGKTRGLRVTFSILIATTS